MTSTGLMDAVLGFAAFNLRGFEPNNTALCHASHRYMTRAIAAHNQQLSQGIKEENAEIILAGSFTIAFVTITSHHYLSHEEPQVLPLHWFQPWAGLNASKSAPTCPNTSPNHPFNPFIQKEDIKANTNQSSTAPWTTSKQAQSSNSSNSSVPNLPLLPPQVTSCPSKKNLHTLRLPA